MQRPSASRRTWRTANQSCFETRKEATAVKSELPKTQKPNPQTPRNQRGTIAHAAATEEPLISFLIGLRLSLFRLGRDEERDLAFGRVFLKMSE
jgi:hypothetical protein